MQPGKYRTTEENDGTVVQQIASKYLPYWPVFLLALALATVVAYFYIRYYTIPSYEATATLIIKDEKKGNEESKLVESLDQISAKKIVENEIEIIQSRKIMEDVVRSLGLYAPIYEKEDAHDVLAYTNFPVSIIALYPDSIRPTDEISIQYIAKTREVLLNNIYKYPLDQFVSTPFGTLKFIENKRFVSPDNGKEFYFTLSDPKAIAPGFLGGLHAESASKSSSIVNLTYGDINSARAADILNEVINAYQKSANDEKDLLASNTLSFVNERLSLVAHDLDSIEKKIQAYKSGNRAVDIGTQGQLFLQNVSANDEKLGDVNTQLAVLDQVEKFVKERKNTSGGIVPSTLGISDPMLSQLITQLYDSELEHDKLSKTVGENNPSLVAISDKINKIKPSILSNIQSQKQSLNATRQNILAINGEYNSLLQNVPQKERHLLDISREQQIKSNLYEFLLQKREESEIAYASAVSNSRVVDFAQANPGPVGPNTRMIYIVFIFLFLGVCGGVIFIKEFLTGKVLYRKELESLTSLPILGEVAFSKSKKKIVIEKGKRGFIAEEFRKLRISLSFLGIDSLHKKILITSSISGEGKSFISANLAISLALTGKRVVIVDMDLNNPTIDRVLDVERGEGVTEFLEGKKAPEEIIRNVDTHENLFFVSAGVILPENPSELLSDGKVNELVDYLENTFDLVIIDTSPMVLVTDGYLLTGLCDATLYIVRHNYTPKILLKRIDENNHINPINNPALIFNGVKMRGFFKNNYGYGYDYVYGNKEIRKRS